MVQLCLIICVIISVLSWRPAQSELGSPDRVSGTLTSDSDWWLVLTGNCHKNYSIVSIVLWFMPCCHHHKLPWVVITTGVSTKDIFTMASLSSSVSHLDSLLNRIILNLMNMRSERRWVMTFDDQQLLTGSWKLAKFISDNKTSQWEVSRNWGELRSIYRIISPLPPWSCDQV